MKIRITENTEDSSNLGHSRGQLDILVTPKDGFTTEDINKALNTKDYYGSYLINTRDKKEVEKAVVTHFGPTHPLAKKKAQAERGGEPFPMKTKEAMDNLIKGLGGDKPGILTWEIKPNGTVLFPSLKNFSQLGTLNILKQVLGAAGIKYKAEKFEDTSKYLSEQVSRMKKIAGITEITVNNPTNIPFNKLQTGSTYNINWNINPHEEENETIKIIEFDSDGDEEWAMIKILSNQDKWMEELGTNTPDDNFIQLFPEDLISAKKI